MGAMRRLLILGSVGAILVATPAASAAPRAWARGPVAQAGMIASVLDVFAGSDQIQGLVRRCADVREESGCTRISHRLRTAIEEASDASIVWVHRMWPNAGVYWVLAPFVWRDDRARLKWAWTDPTPFGCTGGGKAIFTLIDGAWRQTGGGAYEGCP
jgi:hypothetical protein